MITTSDINTILGIKENFQLHGALKDILCPYYPDYSMGNCENVGLFERCDIQRREIFRCV